MDLAYNTSAESPIFIQNPNLDAAVQPAWLGGPQHGGDAGVPGRFRVEHLAPDAADPLTRPKGPMHQFAGPFFLRSLNPATQQRCSQRIQSARRWSDESRPVLENAAIRPFYYRLSEKKTRFPPPLFSPPRLARFFRIAFNEALG